jgi:1-aminocyclopropane-1-carboxylate deaminase/D-cysteine desulfhydrase-like pyridoxal-dependent ACC family enzyme
MASPRDLGSLERFPLLCGPTPLHRLNRASEELGIDLWMKRDDLTGFAAGGNKARKLELLLPHILSSGADWVVTAGSTQSNFVRQMGVACLMAGLGCTAAIMDMPCDGDAPRPSHVPPDEGGNILLDHMAGVELVHVPDGTWEDLDEGRKQAAEVKRTEGKKVYEVPVGGSTVLGACGFCLAGEEFLGQGGADFDAVVTASSSGSTQTGLAYSLHGSGVEVIGIACDPEPELTQDLSDLALDLDDFLGRGVRLQPSDFRFHLDWVGEGYNVPTPEGEEASAWLLKTEGILLDPIYSAKAFSGLLSLARSGRLSGRVCFWHTGGLPTLFAHS